MGNGCALMLPHRYCNILPQESSFALPPGHTRRIDRRRSCDSRPAAAFASLVNIERSPRKSYVVRACSCLGICRDRHPKRQVRACRRPRCPRKRAVYCSEFLVIGFAYFFLARAGLTLASVHPSATPIWPPAGLALAAILLRGLHVWPAIYLASLLANASTEIPNAGVEGQFLT